MQNRICPLWTAVLACHGPALAKSIDISANVGIATDYVYRGISQTMNQPALQAGLYVDHKSGISASAWMANVDYVPAGAPDDGARFEIDLTLGYSFAASERVGIGVSIMRVMTPGTRAGFDYDYDELSAALTVDRHYEITAGFSDSVFGSGQQSLHVSVAATFELGKGFELGTEIGHFDLDVAGDNYRYANLTLGGGYLGFDWQLAGHITSRKARSIFGAAISKPRVVLALSRNFD